MDDHARLRASDAEREEVVDRLRCALEDGRLKLDEYLQRVERAYEAVTYGDLTVLHDDLPAVRPVPAQHLPAPAPARAAAAAATPLPDLRHGFAGLPMPLKVLWVLLGTAVGINVMVWLLVSLTTVSFIYPWPLWVAGPPGVALFALSASVQALRRGHRQHEAVRHDRAHGGPAVPGERRV